MIATRQIVHVNSRKVVVDMGEDYTAFLNRDVEVLIFPCVAEAKQETDKPRPTPWGVMRGTISAIQPDFDKPEDETVWEAAR